MLEPKSGTMIDGLRDWACSEMKNVQAEGWNGELLRGLATMSHLLPPVPSCEMPQDLFTQLS